MTIQSSIYTATSHINNLYQLQSNDYKDVGGVSITSLQNSSTSTVTLSSQALALQAQMNTESLPKRSGMDLLLERIYGLSSWDQVPPPLNKYQAHWMDVVYNKTAFLTPSDYLVLADAYEYADKYNVNLHYVDQVARDLAYFRANDFTYSNHNETAKKNGYINHMVYVHTPETAEIVDKIRNGTGLATTKFDQAYIDRKLEQGYHSIYNVVFFEQLINRQNADGSERGFSEDIIAEYTYSRTQFNYYFNGKLLGPGDEQEWIEVKDEYQQPVNDTEESSEENSYLHLNDIRKMAAALADKKDKKDKTEEEERLLKKLEQWIPVLDFLEMMRKSEDQQQEQEEGALKELQRLFNENFESLKGSDLVLPEDSSTDMK